MTFCLRPQHLRCDATVSHSCCCWTPTQERYPNPVPKQLGPKKLRSERKCSLDRAFVGHVAWRQRTAAYSGDRHPESKYTSHRCRRHVNCGSHGTHMLYLDCQHDPVLLTEHLRGTRESEQRRKRSARWTGHSLGAGARGGGGGRLRGS